MRRWLPGTAALALVLTGCGSTDPRAERRADVEAVVLAANDRDADAVRKAVEQLLSTLREQVAGNEVEREEAERLRAIALRIADTSGALDPAPSPSPSPPPEEPSPEPTEQEEPSPSPTPEEPSPEPTEEEPEEEPSPIVEVPVGESPTPATVSQPAASPQGEEPSPEPTA